MVVLDFSERLISFREEDTKIISSNVVAEVDKWIERFDGLVIGNTCL